MQNIDDIIRSKIGNYQEYHYQDIELRKILTKKISNEVNLFIPKIRSNHSIENEINLRENGYIVFDNFLTKTEVDGLKSYLSDLEGYNAHVPRYSDQILRKLDEHYEFNTMSYGPAPLLANDLVLNKIIDPNILSLAQSYLGCFPTLYSLNSWWHIFKELNIPYWNHEKMDTDYKKTPVIYVTQKNHRDHDDFKFLSLFIYLTDIDEATGPHIFYPGTQDGSDSETFVKITGKAGTAVLADTFAIHRGEPLQKDKRLLCWWRYGLYINSMHYADGNDKFKTKSIFDHLPETEHYKYLFRAFLDNN